MRLRKSNAGYIGSIHMTTTTDETIDRYTSALERADQHRLDVETRSYSGEKLKAETERRKTALIEAHRRVADQLERMTQR